MNTSNETPLGRRRFVRYLALGTGAAIVGPTVLAACGSDDKTSSDTAVATTAAPATTATTATAETATTVATSSAGTSAGSAAGTTGATTAGSGGGATTAPTITKASVSLQLSWVKTVEFAGYFLADDKGWYKDLGLDVNLVAGGPNAPQPEQSILGGATQFGVPAFSNLVSAIKAGADLVAIGAQLQKNMVGFISLPKNPVTKLADLVGKKIGGSNPADEDVYKKLLQSAGLEPKFTFVPTGSDPTPLTEGAVDVYVGFINNQPLTLKEQGVDTVILSFQDVGIPSYTGTMCVQRSYLAKNRDIVKNFLRATVMGYQLNAKDPAPGAELTVTKYSTDQGLTVPKETASNVVYIAAQSSDVTKAKGYYYMDTDFIAKDIYTGLEKYGLTDLPDPTKWVDLSLLDEIYDGKTTLL